MGIKRSLVEFVHDEGYGDDLLLHINAAIRGKDMRAESVVDGNLLGSAKQMTKALNYHDRLLGLVERLSELARWALSNQEDQSDASLCEADEIVRECRT